MRLLHRLGDHVPGGHVDERALVPGEGRLGHAAQGDAQRLVPLGPLLAGVDVEAAQLGDGRRLAGAELDPAVGDEVEGTDALSHTEGVVDVRRHVHDAVAEPDVLGALAGGGQEDLRRRRVRVLLEEVVLGEPHAVDADLVGQLHQLESVLEDLALLVLAPRLGDGMLQEQRDLHDAPPC